MYWHQIVLIYKSLRFVIFSGLNIEERQSEYLKFSIIFFFIYFFFIYVYQQTEKAAKLPVLRLRALRENKNGDINKNTDKILTLYFYLFPILKLKFNR